MNKVWLKVLNDTLQNIDLETLWLKQWFIVCQTWNMQQQIFTKFDYPLGFFWRG